jgi:hypothetical protein
MRIILFILILLTPKTCLSQPPFSNFYRRPNIHPYTFININSNAMDYQQMFYLRDKYEDINVKNNSYNKNKKQQIYVNPNIHTNTIRPTGHKTYFMNLP